VIVDLNLHQKDDKYYLEIVVEPYPYPVSYRGQYHYRTGSSKQELKAAALDKFLLNKQGKKWDGVPLPNIALDDFSQNSIELFKQKTQNKMRIEKDLLDEDTKSLLNKLHLIDGQYFKRTSILLFGKDTQKFISGSYIKIGFFNDDEELLYHNIISGSLIEQVDKVEELLFTKYLKAIISYKGTQRIEKYPISYLAFREAIINAIVHKDYGKLFPIQINVYEDKLLIWNCGELPNNWDTSVLLQKHSSQPFNPDIANVFFLAGLIESWGTGINKIINESKKYNNITPTFKYDNGLWVEFDFSLLVTPQVNSIEETVRKQRV
jgi:ATP-dependent DNA helicase RecG